MDKVGSIARRTTDPLAPFLQFTHDDKLFQRDQPEMIAKIQRRRQQKRSSSAMKYVPTQ